MMLAEDLAARFVLHPTTLAVPADGLERRTLAAAGGTIEVWVRPAPEGAAPGLFVLHFCGAGGRAERSLLRFRDCWPDPAVEAWSPNYPGFGGSDGPAGLGGIASAALAAYDALAVRTGGRRILISGDSLGSAVALCVAARRDAAALLVRNPPPLREIFVERHGWWNGMLPAAFVARAGLPAELDALANSAACRVPAVFLSSGRDEVVPPRLQMRVFRSYAGPKHLLRIPAATHRTSVPPGAARRVAELLAAALWEPGDRVT